MRYLKTFEGKNLKYKGVTEEEFIQIFNENCKNFSLTNDQLYRNDEESFIFGLHEPIERNSRGITYVDYFVQKEKDVEKYPVVRKNSAIGIGGGDKSEMIRTCGMLGDSSGESESTVYIVIPFDNSKMVFCSAPDLMMIDYLMKGKIGDDMKVTDNDFVMVEYSKKFKVPVEELLIIQKRLLGQKADRVKGKGFEFFMSSPALLLNIKNKVFLKNL